MKKIYLIFLTLFCSAVCAQSFFSPTSYRGAFGEVDDWTKDWASWDPQNINYPSTTTSVTGDITVNTTWGTGSVIELKNKVYVTGGATLTIMPGVIIRGDKSTGGTLIISRGSKIMAQGTASQPIVFTSNQPAGSRAPGDWGGLILLGAAANNQGLAVIEGGLDAVKAEYGGSNDGDNSGILQYIRIEFAGIPFQPDKEINGLTLGSVGSGTAIDHIQVSFCNDDSFEWFGGTVNAKYLIAYRGVDDNFDTDFGFRGKVQFALGVRDPNLADQAAGSTSEGFESDNDATGTAASPRTAAVFSNVTEIGPYRGTTGTIDPKFQRALRIRRNSALSVFNSVFTGWPVGLHIDGVSSETNAANAELVFNNNLLGGMKKNLQINNGSSFNIKNFFTTGSNDSIINAADVKLVNPYDFTNPDFRLQAGSPALTGADFSHPKLGTTGIGSIKQVTGWSHLYPNPARNGIHLSVRLNQASEVKICIYDVSGKLLANFSETGIYGAGQQAIPVHCTHLEEGIYFVEVSSENRREILKLVKQ